MVLLLIVSVVVRATRVSVVVGSVRVPVLTIEEKDGVTSVGEFDSTEFQVPVLVVTPVPPLTTGKTPVIAVVSGILENVLLPPSILLFVRVFVLLAVKNDKPVI